MKFKTRQEALKFIFTYEFSTYPPLDYKNMSDNDVFERADEIYELLEIMEKKSKLKELSKN